MLKFFVDPYQHFQLTEENDNLCLIQYDDFDCMSNHDDQFQDIESSKKTKYVIDNDVVFVVTYFDCDLKESITEEIHVDDFANKYKKLGFESNVYYCGDEFLRFLFTYADVI